MVDYDKRLAEVDVVLNYLSDEDLAKIPEDVRLAIKENKDKDYVWDYDESKALKDQGLSSDTIAVLAYLNSEYLLNEEQKKLMNQIYEFNERKAEKEKSEKYSAENLFKAQEKYVEQVQETPKEELPEQKMEIAVYNQNIFSKVWKKIKSFFGI